MLSSGAVVLTPNTLAPYSAMTANASCNVSGALVVAPTTFFSCAPKLPESSPRSFTLTLAKMGLLLTFANPMSAHLRVVVLVKPASK